MSDPTIAAVLAAALDAYGELEALGEEVEDEWTYVTDLEAAWRERLEAAIAERGDEAATPGMEAAVARAVDEIGRIRDPHRAIDWLSTYPQVVLLAIGEQP
jgi:alkylhydroperoxidase family enzyme